jgi:hypothetical protein
MTMNRSRAVSAFYILPTMLLITSAVKPLSVFQSRQSVPEESSSSGQANAEDKLKFTAGILGQLTENGEKLGFTDIQASDGVSLKVMYKSFGDAHQASEFFEKEIGRAVRTDKRGKKINRTGKVVGERAQVLFASIVTGEDYPAVLWTDGRQFHLIESKSLADILELERVYRY